MDSVTPPDPLRALPSIETLMRETALERALETVPRMLLLEAARHEVAIERARARKRGASPSSASEIATRAAERARRAMEPQLRRVINATGVVLHTNLGRAPLAGPARRAVDEIARGYSSLELDLATGRRGDRGTGVARWLTRLTGAEAALAVNNGAGAVLLALSALASGKSVAVSRGELVEIGGSFRIPDILEKSGAKLLEVGTTNRTHVRDYAHAIEKGGVGAILRVHRSNFRLEGFATRPTLAELAALARKARIPLIEDLGSGALVDLAALGLEHEPTVAESLADGVDVVTFSGDKLLGGSQAGLIVGRRKLLERIAADPLARALRLDKLALAALEATLPLLVEPGRAAHEIPTLAMLRISEADLLARAERLGLALEAAIPGLASKVAPAEGEVGGGALPLRELPGWVVEVRVLNRGALELQTAARAGDPPVIGIVRSDAFRLDPRTLSIEELEELPHVLAQAWGWA
jgi:L-seryl-tRNA(Ser) seleniumtransferase